MRAWLVLRAAVVAAVVAGATADCPWPEYDFEATAAAFSVLFH
jgi:hypothetical protein